MDEQLLILFERKNKARERCQEFYRTLDVLGIHHLDGTAQKIGASLSAEYVQAIRDYEAFAQAIAPESRL